MKEKERRGGKKKERGGFFVGCLGTSYDTGGRGDKGGSFSFL